MKYSLKSIFGFAFLVAFSLMFTSCEKQNVDEIIEEVTELPADDKERKISIISQGNTTVLDAYAAYCNQNNKEYLTVTNNQALLSNTTVVSVSSDDLDNGDFVILYVIDSIGATPVDVVLWSSIDTTQSPTIIEFLAGSSSTFTFSVDPLLNEVQGNMTGNFVTGLLGGNPVFIPFTVSFDADIVQPHTFCN